MYCLFIHFIFFMLKLYHKKGATAMWIEPTATGKYKYVERYEDYPGV